jgi:hypothetical protein
MLVTGGERYAGEAGSTAAPASPELSGLSLALSTGMPRPPLTLGTAEPSTGPAR